MVFLTARPMEMAYSKAWTITKGAEEGLGVKLLLSTTGGKGGITASGMRPLRLVGDFNSVCRM